MAKKNNVSEYIVAHSVISKATAKADDLIGKGYTPWGAPSFASPNTKEPVWIQVFIKVEED